METTFRLKLHDSKVLTLLNRMVDALDVELKTVTRLFKGSEYRLVKGRVIGPGLYEFTLKLMGRRPPLPDARIRVRDVSGAETWGDLLAIDGDKVILRLESNLGNLSAATMVVDLSFLIVEEKKKLLAYRDHFNTRLSRLPEAVFFSLPSKKPLNRLPANDSVLDELQLSALSKSLDHSFHMVWGPPGSGKTRTLAAVALEAAKAGKKVLLTAHTHSALDSLLLQVKKGWRNDLRIVRLGHSTNPGVEEFCADVQAEKHVADLKDAVKKLEDAAAFLKTNGQALRNVLRKVLSWLDYLEYEEKLLKKEYALLQHLEKTHQQRLSQLTELRDAKPGVLDRLPIISRVARERRERQVEQLENLLNNIALNLRKTRDEINSRMKKVSIVKQALATVEEIGFLGGSVTRDSLLALISGIQRLAGENTSNTEGFVAVKAEHLHLLKEASPHLRLLLKNPDLEAELKRLKSQMQTKIYDAKLSLLRNADIVAATITKTVTEVFDLVFASGREGEPRLARFDLAVVDEASMVRLSQVWIVSSLAERVVLGGDPKQLPPIVMTSKKQHPDHYGILKTDVFSFRGVDTGSYQELSTLLEKQYRMSRKICDVVSGLFYHGRLKATRDSKGEIILFDTSHLLGAVDVPTVDGSRMNALYALTDLYAVKHLTSRFGLRDEDIAVITPYRAQAELLTSLFTDSGLYGVACGTIHTFQGMERRAVIIDLVKVGDYGRSPLLRGDDGLRLLNTAISRGMDYLCIVGNRQSMVGETLHPLKTIIYNLDSSVAVTPNDIMHDVEEDLEVDVGGQQVIFGWSNIYRSILSDLRRAEKWAVVVSPFIADGMLDKFIADLPPHLEVTLYTNPSQIRSNPSLTRNVRIVTKPRIHNKLVIVDGRILYNGSCNILNPSKSSDHMVRQVVAGRYGYRVVAEFLAKFPKAN